MLFAPIAICWYCTDEYEPTEITCVPQDPGEPQFCSDDCVERWTAAEDAAEAYDSAGYAAPVFGP